MEDIIPSGGAEGILLPLPDVGFMRSVNTSKMQQRAIPMDGETQGQAIRPALNVGGGKWRIYF